MQTKIQLALEQEASLRSTLEDIYRDLEAARRIIIKQEFEINSLKYEKELANSQIEKMTAMAPDSFLATLADLFPKQVRKGCMPTSATGWIPIEYFEQHESEIAELCKQYNLRRIYRGPRYTRTRASTRRRDAHHVVLYYK